jgi:hypothetical protein
MLQQHLSCSYVLLMKIWYFFNDFTILESNENLFNFVLIVLSCLEFNEKKGISISFKKNLKWNLTHPNTREI